MPVVCNAGIGDTDELLVAEKVGVVIEAFDRESYRKAALAALALSRDPGIRARTMASARRHFDLVEVGGARYRNVYRRLEENRGQKAVGERQYAVKQ